MGDLSQDFSRWEFACGDRCGRDMPTDALLQLVQTMRTRNGGPMEIVSGVRCEHHNRHVGGSRKSQHIAARAADVPGGYATVRQWRDAGAIGMGLRRGLVVHVDVRPGRGPFTFED